MNDEFHAHLDACKQCEKNPFALCAVGARLIKEEALEKNPIRCGHTICSQVFIETGDPACQHENGTAQLILQEKG